MNVSVVIPAYNREKTIENAIMSVLNQSVKPLEVIVVDDKSTDSTVKVVRALCKENDMVKLIRLKKNSGAQAARNRGIKAAKGEWIAFLDSDDEWLENKLELQQEAIMSNPQCDVFYGDYYVKTKYRKQYRGCWMNEKNGSYLEQILICSKILFQSLLVRKSSLEDIGLLDNYVPSYQEWDTSIRLAVNHKICYINKPLFIYNVYDGDTISNDFKRLVSGFRYVILSNRELYYKYIGIKAASLFYDGIYERYKRNNDYRMYYYLCISKITYMVSKNSELSDRYMKLIKIIWGLRWKLNR